MFVLGVFLVLIFPHSDWIRRDTPYLPVFSPNAGKYGPEKLRIRTLYTQCSTLNPRVVIYGNAYLLLYCYIWRTVYCETLKFWLDTAFIFTNTLVVFLIFPTRIINSCMLLSIFFNSLLLTFCGRSSTGLQHTQIEYY